MTQEKDRLFAEPKNEIDAFDFGSKTAEVFDDMLQRSVPLYRELQRMTGELANEFAVAGTHVYDLGCSTGSTLQTLCAKVEQEVRFVGVDFSEAMLEKAQDNFKRLDIRRDYGFEQADLNGEVRIENASVVVLNLTLQFVRPRHRDRLIREIASGLVEGGCLILVEKVLGNDPLFDRGFVKFHYEMKRRNGYSELEIAQKREALENVLIPYSVEENLGLLRRNGFGRTDLFFKWYNFCGLLGIK